MSRLSKRGMIGSLQVVKGIKLLMQINYPFLYWRNNE